MSFSSQATRSSKTASAGGSTSAMASAASSGSSSVFSVRIAEELLDRSGEVLEELSRLEEQAIAQVGEVRLQDLGREDLAGAVGEVVRLVDQEDRLAQILAGQVPQRRGGLEDVVVVGHDRVRALRRPRAGPRTGRPPRAGPPRRPCRGRGARSRRAGGRGCWSAPSSPDSPWRSGRTPRGRGCGRSRTSAPWRGPGRCGTRARSSPRARRRPSSAAASSRSGRRPGGRS